MSKIQQELAAATEVNPKRGETIDDADYKKRLCKAVGELGDKDWNKLSSKAQDWFNETVDLVNAKKDPADWPDAEEKKEEERPTTRRRAAEAEEKKDDELPKPKKGDTVKVTTRRGKEYAGVVVDPDDNGELVIDDGKEEIGISLSSIATLSVAGDEKPEAGSRRRKAAEEDEGPAEPAVGDTVQLTTKRGKVVMGNIVEIDDKIVVLKTTSGDEEEYDKDRVESLVVKAKNSGAAKDRPAGDDDEKPASRRSGGDAGKKEEAGDKKRVAKSENGGVSVGTRARELMCDDPKLSKEDLMKALKKEGLEFKDSTIGMIHADCCKMFDMLRARKMLKA